MEKLIQLSAEIIDNPMDSHEFTRLVQQTKGMTGNDVILWLSTLSIEQLQGIKKCSGYLLNFAHEELSKREDHELCFARD